MAHPFRRRGHLLPAARLDLAMNGTVVAMSVLRAEHRGDQDDDADPFDDLYEPPGPGWADPRGQYRRWPGDTDNDLSGR